ncbi:MAG: TrkA C-terminal domain-containing protein, partial [Selenomonas sp.]|nr:TrkA C-terminal domain-containing protein [Selenomonas sp.]
FENRVNLSLREVLVTSDHPLCGHRLMDAKQNIREGGLVVLVQRGGENIIPSGLTEIMENDMLVLAEYEE